MTTSERAMPPSPGRRGAGAAHPAGKLRARSWLGPLRIRLLALVLLALAPAVVLLARAARAPDPAASLPLVGLVVVAGLGALVLGEVLILRRVERLLHAVRRFSEGDLGARTGGTSGAGELSELEKAFDEMASSLEGREEQLRDAEARHRQLVEEAPAVFYEARGEPARPFTFVSPQAERLGLAPADLVGRHDAWVSLLHPDDRDAVVADFTRCLEEERPFVATYRIRTRDGRVLWVRDTGACAGAADTRVCRGFLLDVTAERLAEERFLQAQKMEAIGRLASGVAHDFNNLLTVMTGYAQVLLAATPPGDPRRADLEELEAATARGIAFTRQLLSFARKQASQPVAVSLSDVVRGAEGMLRRLVGSDVALVFDLAEGLPLVRVDPAHLEQALVNLAANARDAMPSGGTLRIATSLDDPGEDRGAARGERTGPHVVLTVADSGTGMDPETRAHLFEPFFTTKARGKGTGLGLPSVYGVVTQHGGLVEVESELGAGTTFRLVFPALPAGGEAARAAAGEGTDAPVPGAASTGPSKRGARRATILVVEDEAPVREAIKGMLTSQGHLVLEAHDGRSALDVSRVHEGPIDLLLADSTGHEMSGAELATLVGAARPETRILLMSGSSAADVVGPGMAGAGRAFLQKPFTSAALERAIAGALGA